MLPVSTVLVQTCDDQPGTFLQSTVIRDEAVLQVIILVEVTFPWIVEMAYTVYIRHMHTGSVPVAFSPMSYVYAAAAAAVESDYPLQDNT